MGSELWRLNEASRVWHVGDKTGLASTHPVVTPSREAGRQIQVPQTHNVYSRLSSRLCLQTCSVGELTTPLGSFPGPSLHPAQHSTPLGILETKGNKERAQGSLAGRTSVSPTEEEVCSPGRHKSTDRVVSKSEFCLPTVLEPGSPKSGCQHRWVLARGQGLAGFAGTAFSLCPHVGRRQPREECFLGPLL